MDAFYFSIGGFVWVIALFKRELLVEKEGFRIILGVSITLFLAGLILHFTVAGQQSGAGALLAPLLSLGMFRLCRRLFLKRFNREPRDTWLNWSEGMGADRVFNIVYFVSTLWLLMFTTIGMMELAKVGW